MATYHTAILTCQLHWHVLAFDTLNQRLTIHAEDQGHLDLVVKRYPSGKSSSNLHSLQPGQSISFRPMPGYAWAPNKHEHITLLAGGASITPMLQLAQGILRNPSDKTKITLVFGNNTDEDVLLKPDFDELEQKYPEQFKAHYSQPSGIRVALQEGIRGQGFTREGDAQTRWRQDEGLFVWAAGHGRVGGREERLVREHS